MAALAVHALALLGDSYLSPSLADVTLPLQAAPPRHCVSVVDRRIRQQALSETPIPLCWRSISDGLEGDQ